MRDEVREDLETQLAEARASWQQAEQDGEELALRALQSDEKVKDLEARLARQSDYGWDLREKDSQRCRMLERVIAIQTSVFIFQFASFLGDKGVFLEYPGIKLKAYLMCCTPCLYLYVRNGWRRFTRKHLWNSWRDNDIVDGLKENWNELMGSN